MPGDIPIGPVTEVEGGYKVEVAHPHSNLRQDEVHFKKRDDDPETVFVDTPTTQDPRDRRFAVPLQRRLNGAVRGQVKLEGAHGLGYEVVEAKFDPESPDHEQGHNRIELDVFRMRDRYEPRTH